jgi:hypothetical protein
VTKKGSDTFYCSYAESSNRRKLQSTNSEKNVEIVIRKCISFYDLAGTGAGEATVEELKSELDKMREEDNDD